MRSWADKLRKVVPYTPGEQPDKAGMIKLNTNENPYPPAPGVKKALESLDDQRLRLYPNTTAKPLAKALAKYYRVEPDQVFIGVGSDDVLAIAFMTFFNSDKPIFFPDITYSFYPVWANLFKIPYETKALDRDFKIVREDYRAPNGGIIFPNPNAPTSYYESLDLVEDIVRHNQDVIVIVDEAYIDYSGESALKLINKYDNLLIVQTFSKSRSMAGMRIGYAMGNPELIRAMNDVKFSYNSYTMNMPSIYSGIEAVNDEAYFIDHIRKILETRKWTESQLSQLGFEFPVPGGNFIFAAHPEYQAKDLFTALREKKIYVRYFDLPRIDNYLRITIGTDEEMKSFIDAISEITQVN